MTSDAPTLEVRQFPASGGTVIICDKWFASYLRQAVGMGPDPETAGYDYVPHMRETIRAEFDRIQDLGPADDLTGELREEVDQLHTTGRR